MYMHNKSTVTRFDKTPKPHIRSGPQIAYLPYERSICVSCVMAITYIT